MATQEFYCAYMNVGLRADGVWRYNRNPDPYEKTNEDLWIRFNELNKVDNDVDAANISFKYLARCFNKEECYSFTFSTSNRKIINSSNNHYECFTAEMIRDRDNEVWMLPEVEEEFKRLTCTVSSRWSHTSLQQLAVEEEFPSVNLRESSTHEFFTSTPWPQTLLAYYPDLPNILRDSTNLSVFSTKNYAGTEELDLPSVFVSPSLKDIWSNSSTEGDVQKFCKESLFVQNNCTHDIGLHEFYPVICQGPRKEFPTVCDLTYESDLFPYSVPSTVSGFSEPATFPVVSSSIPVYQRPPELYNPNVFRKRNTNSGADHSNLILLTSSDGDRKTDDLESVSSVDMKKLNNNCDATRIRAKRFSNTKGNNKEPCDEMLAQVNKWLDKVYPIRSTNFADIATVIETMNNLSKTFCSNYAITVSSTNQKHQSDLQNKYDELEREALEQYSGSDTNLFLRNSNHSSITPSQTDFVEQKFQDLEREALEQYEDTNITTDN